ncbi:MAG: hypothetical protein H7834_01825 [Magnetococcus sp. YQC-9]
MAAILFIGDEVSAAAWRLIGVRVSIPPSGQEERIVGEALAGSCELLLLSASSARLISKSLMERFSTSIHPLTLVVPDATGRVMPPDLAGIIRARLGMAS